MLRVHWDVHYIGLYVDLLFLLSTFFKNVMTGEILLTLPFAYLQSCSIILSPPQTQLYSVTDIILQCNDRNIIYCH